VALTPFVAIIGAGDIGGATAEAIARAEVAREIRLIDPAAGVAAGMALDIAQAAPMDGCNCRLTGTSDTRAAAGAAAIVLADYAAAPGQRSREVHGEEGLALLRRLWPVVSADTTPIVCAGADHAGLIASAVLELKIDRRRLVGSAPAAFEAGARALVALALDGNAREISLLVVGALPHVPIPCWSQATTGGTLLTARLTPAEIGRIAARLPALWPPGPYALGTAAAAVVRGVLSEARHELTCFVALDGEMGVRRNVAALPVRVGPAGVVRIVEPALSPQERVRFENGSVAV
jgi:malate dehydrogenase